MARKQLIKGANAARVEARISRAPADLDAAPSIFGALKAMEMAATVSARPTAATPAAATRPARPSSARPRAAAPTATARPSKPAARPTAMRPAALPAPKAELPAKAPAITKRKGIGPSDFSAAEREAILRCCTDYRNRLPTYLLAVQKEVSIIDAIIEKCRSSLPESGDASGKR